MIRHATLALCFLPFAALADLPTQETWPEAAQALTTADGLQLPCAADLA